MADESSESGVNETVETPQLAKNDDGTLTITQAELDRRFAGHKRQLQAQLKEAQQRAAMADQLQAQVSELLDSGLIDGVEDLEGFRDGVSQTLDRFKTDKERLEAEQKKANKALETANKRAETAETRFKSAMVNQAIVDEAASKATSPGSLNLIKMHLQQFAQADDEGNVSFIMDVTNEDGTKEQKALSASEAVSLMESQVSDFGALFRSTVSGGTGVQGEVVDGVTRTPDGGIDFSKMSPQKYFELYEKNPEAITLALQRR